MLKVLHFVFDLLKLESKLLFGLLLLNCSRHFIFSFLVQSQQLMLSALSRTDAISNFSLHLLHLSFLLLLFQSILIHVTLRLRCFAFLQTDLVSGLLQSVCEGLLLTALLLQLSFELLLTIS